MSLGSHNIVHISDNQILEVKITMRTFRSNQDGVTESRFALPPEQTKNGQSI
jgi:hypothetical protein